MTEATTPTSETFVVTDPISTPHAARTAERLARLRREPRKDKFAKQLEHRMWMLLDSNADAREAFQCPDGVTIAEHAASMTADQLEEIAEQLNEATG